MKAYEALAQALVAEGVDTVFGLIGGGVDMVLAELTGKYGVRFIPTRHEEAAVGMADGYSRATGKIGVALVAYGPGLAKTGATLIAARMAGSPVLLICGETHDRLNPMRWDQHPFLLATAGAAQHIRVPARLAEDVQLAFRHLRLGKGPIALSIADSNAVIDDATWNYNPNGISKVVARPAHPDDDQIATAARMLAGAERPVLLAGRGAVHAGAKDAIVALAEQTGAVLATTLLAKDWFRGHPLNAGMAGGFAPAPAREIFREADLVIAFGAGLNQITTSFGNVFPHARYVQVDTNPEAINNITLIDHAVLADAREAAEALALRTERTGPGWNGHAVEDTLAAIDPWAGIDFSETPGYVNPHAAARMMEDLLPRERQLIIDIGLFMGIPAVRLSVPDPRDLVFPWHLGLVGIGLSVAMGAAVSRPDRRTVLVTGDGGIMASLNDLDTAARCNIPITIIVMDDSGFGAERRLFRRDGKETNVAEYPSADVAGAARALGLHAHRAATLDDLYAALRDINTSDQPALIQVLVHPDARFDEMQGYFAR